MCKFFNLTLLACVQQRFSLRLASKATSKQAVVAGRNSTLYHRAVNTSRSLDSSIANSLLESMLEINSSISAQKLLEHATEMQRVDQQLDFESREWLQHEKRMRTTPSEITAAVNTALASIAADPAYPTLGSMDTADSHDLPRLKIKLDVGMPVFSRLCTRRVAKITNLVSNHTQTSSTDGKLWELIRTKVPDLSSRVVNWSKDVNEICDGLRNLLSVDGPIRLEHLSWLSNWLGDNMDKIEKFIQKKSLVESNAVKAALAPLEFDTGLNTPSR